MGTLQIVRPFSTPPMGDMGIWLDPTRNVSVSSVNVMSHWVDRAREYDLTPGFGALRTELNMINNRNVVEQNGASQGMVATGVTMTNAGTFYMVFRCTAGNDDQGTVYSDGGGNYFPAVIKPSTNQMYGWDGSNFVFGSFPSLTSTNYLLTFKVSGTTGTIYRNGTSVGSGTWASSAARTNFRVGNGGTNNRLKYGDILWYPATHTDPERTANEAWLMERWGL